METSFVTTPALFRGLGFSGWQGTTSEEALKVALLCNRQLYNPLSENSLDWLCRQFAEREGISPKKLQNIWISSPVNPSTFDPAFLLDVKEFLFRGFIDKRIRYQDRSYYLLLLAQIVEAEEKGSQQWYEHLFSIGAFFMLSFIDSIIWDRYSLLNREVSLIASDDSIIDYRILRRYLVTKQDSRQSIEKQRQFLELHVPDFGKLPWSVILDLRRDKRLKSFQEHLDKLSDTKDEMSGVKRALDEVWKATSEITPHIPSVVLEGIAGNLPLPIPVNPLSIGASFVAFVRAVRWKKANQWFTLIQQLRKSASASKPTLPSVAKGPFIGEGMDLKEGEMWLTNFPSDENYAESRLHDKLIYLKGRYCRLIFRSDSSIDIFQKKLA
jgi:hypothetical protein